MRLLVITLFFICFTYQAVNILDSCQLHKNYQQILKSKHIDVSLSITKYIFNIILDIFIMIVGFYAISTFFYIIIHPIQILKIFCMAMLTRSFRIKNISSIYNDYSEDEVILSSDDNISDN